MKLVNIHIPNLFIKKNRENKNLEYMHKRSDLSDHLHKVFSVLWGQSLYLPRTGLQRGSMGHNQHCISCWTPHGKMVNITCLKS